MENIIQYYPSAISHVDGPDTNHVLNLIRNNPDDVHYLVAKGFNPVFLRTCFNEPNCRIIFYKRDGFDTETKNQFIAGTPPDRKKSEIIFLSGDSSRDEIVDTLTREASSHIWNTDTPPSCGPSTLLFLANSPNFSDRIFINATGYTSAIIDMTLDPPHKPTIFIKKTDNYTSVAIKTLIQKGGSKIHILAEGYTDAELADFDGATIIASDLMV